MEASEFDPDDPRDAMAFAKGVMAASADASERRARYEHHTAEAEDAKRVAGLLAACAFFLIGGALTADQWWIGLVGFLAGITCVISAAAKVKAWRTHTATALTYRSEASR